MRPISPPTDRPRTLDVRHSTRAAGPFLALNCAALPEQLLESELFGYERGAFTGAQQPKPGQLELAAGGVLFLDEVSETSASAQAKFLRVLQEREFQRLGGTRTLKANVRVVAATNRDLKKAMERGDFREDLYFRLQVFDIKLPPLSTTGPAMSESCTTSGDPLRRGSDYRRAPSSDGGPIAVRISPRRCCADDRPECRRTRPDRPCAE